MKFYKPYSFRIHHWPNYMREKAKWKNCGSQLFPIYIKEEPKIEDNYLIVGQVAKIAVERKLNHP